MRKLFLLAFALLLSLSAFTQTTRHFTLRYAFSVRNVQPGEKLEIWFPQAYSDQFQDVKIVSVTGDLPLTTTRDAKYGNTIYHAVTSKAAKDEYAFDVQFDVVRRERIGLPRDGQQPQLVKVSAKQALAPDKLVPTTGKLAAIAAQQVQGHTGTMDKARALYDYVFTTMKYDKTGTEWGRGDAEWACDSKRGNCTDFHSVFISMARSQGIPARLEIGFPLPAAKTSGDIAGYHCWAEFYDSKYGWVPVDISEA
jgi:hypothetical protein